MTTKTDLPPAPTAGPSVSTWAGLAALDQAALRAAAGALTTAPLPAVNTALVSPAGFDPFDDDGPGSPPRPVAQLGTTPAGTLRLYDGRTRLAGFGRPAVLDAAQLAVLRRYAGVRVPFGAGAGPVELAGLLRQLLVAGVPVLAPDLPLVVRRLLGAELGRLVATVTPATLADPYRRERWSVAARRVALRTATAAAGVASSPPTVTAVVDAGAERLLGQLRRQTWPRLAVRIAAADGDTVAERPGVEVVRAATRAAARRLALETCTTELATVPAAELELGPEHVTDLVLGRGYGRRPVSGVQVRLTHLEPLDVTVRGPGGPGELPARTLTAGTVLGAPQALLELGVDAAGDRTADLDVGDDGYAIHDLNVHRSVRAGAGVDEVLRAGGRQLPGTGRADPAYASYFSRML